MYVEEAAYFDATPEGSVIFDWDLPASGPATSSSSLPFCTQGAPAARGDGGGEEHSSGQGNKKARPPKLVREVRDLQESIKLLSRKVESKADCGIVHVALDKKAAQQDLDERLEQKVSLQDLDAVLRQKVSQEDFEILSEGMKKKLESAALDEALQQKVSQHVFQEALSAKASHEHFEQLRHRVKKKLDSTLGSLQQGLDQKTNHIEFQKLCFNVEGKADRASVQAALGRKVSWDAVTWRMVSCGALWALTVTACAAMIAFLFHLVLRQQQQLQQLNSFNKELISNMDRLQLQQHWINETLEDFASAKQIIKQLKAPAIHSLTQIDAILGDSFQRDLNKKVPAHNQVFKSGKLYDDTYTVELVPPFANAWLIVDASLGAAGSVCSGKADAILRAEHKIFSFYEPPAIQDGSTTATVAGGSITVVAPEDDDRGAVSPTTTTTTTTSKTCMIMTTALKEQQGGSIVVLINFKRDPEHLDGVNNSSIYDVSGQIQWFPQ